jgi:hypothetical protein
MKLPVAFAVNLALQIAAWVWFSFPRIKHHSSWCMNASTGLKVTPKEKWR